VDGSGGAGEGAGDCALYAGGSEWCAMCVMSAGGHALHAVLHAAMYSGRRRGRALFAGSARCAMCWSPAL